MDDIINQNALFSGDISRVTYENNVSIIKGLY